MSDVYKLDPYNFNLNTVNTYSPAKGYPTNGMDWSNLQSYNGQVVKDVPMFNDVSPIKPEYLKPVNTNTTGNFKDISGNVWGSESEMQKANLGINDYKSLANIPDPNKTPDMFDNVTAKGFADVGGGLASLYSIYNGIEANKRADEAFKLQKAEYSRGVQREKDFAAGIAKSGLGTYSAGV